MIGDLLVLEDSDLENFWEGSQENPEKVLEDDFFESLKEWPKKKSSKARSAKIFWSMHIEDC